MTQAAPRANAANPGREDSVRRAPTSGIAQSSLPERLTLEERRVMEQLHRHVGHDNAIPQARMAFLAGLAGKDADRKLQVILKNLREQHGIPAVALCTGKPKGVFLAETPEELEAYIEQTGNRAQSLYVGNAACKRMLAQMLRASDGLPFYESAVSDSERGGYTRVRAICVECLNEFTPTAGKELSQVYCAELCRYRAANRRRAS